LSGVLRLQTTQSRGGSETSRWSVVWSRVNSCAHGSQRVHQPFVVKGNNLGSAATRSQLACRLAANTTVTVKKPTWARGECSHARSPSSQPHVGRTSNSAIRARMDVYSTSSATRPRSAARTYNEQDDRHTPRQRKHTHTHTHAPNERTATLSPPPSLAGSQLDVHTRPSGCCAIVLSVNAHRSHTLAQQVAVARPCVRLGALRLFLLHVLLLVLLRLLPEIVQLQDRPTIIFRQPLSPLLWLQCHHPAYRPTTS
jgi:hypothetical protein